MKISYKLDNDGRPIIDAIVVFETYVDEEAFEGQPPSMKVRALIDTGAQGCVMAPRVVEAIKPRHIGQAPHTSLASDVRMADCYVCEVVFGKGEQIAGVSAVQFIKEELPEGMDVLLGMPFIKHATWQFNPDGTFTATVVDPNPDKSA